MPKRANKQYTLIELIVTIAIIGILASLLISVMKVAKEEQKKLQCKDNMKNIGVAKMGYIDDNNGFLVNNTLVKGDEANRSRSWDDFLGLGRYDGRSFKLNGNEKKHNWVPWNSEVKNDPGFASMYQCPDDDPSRISTSAFRRSYKLTQSSYLNGDVGLLGISERFVQTPEDFDAGKIVNADRVVRMRDPGDKIIMTEIREGNYLGRSVHGLTRAREQRDFHMVNGEQHHDEPMKFMALLGDFSVKHLHFQDTYDANVRDLMTHPNVSGSMWDAFGD